MKIPGLIESNNKPYGFIMDEKVSTKDEIACETGKSVPHSN